MKEYVLSQFNSLMEKIINIYTFKPLAYYYYTNIFDEFIVEFDVLVEPFKNPIVFTEVRNFLTDFIKLLNSEVSMKIVKVLYAELVKLFTANIDFLSPHCPKALDIPSKKRVNVDQQMAFSTKRFKTSC